MFRKGIVKAAIISIALCGIFLAVYMFLGFTPLQESFQVTEAHADIPAFAYHLDPAHLPERYAQWHRLCCKNWI